MRKFKVNMRYKLLYAALLLAILLLFLFVCFLMGKDAEDLSDKAFIWGVFYLFTYIVFIARMKILITDKGELVCKPSNAISDENIAISQITAMEIQRGYLFSKVILYYNANDKVVLYPTDCTSLIESIKAEQDITRT